MSDIRIPEEVKRCKKKVQEIDDWLNEYTGNDDKLIDKKLDEQEKCLKTIKDFQNALANRDW